MLSINQLAWVANVLVSTVSGRAVGVRRPAIRCEEGIASPVQPWGSEKQMVPLGLPERKKVGRTADGMVPFFWEGAHFSRFIGNFNDLFLFFNLCVAHMQIFSTSNMSSRDGQVYVACVQVAEHSVWFPALCHWKAGARSTWSPNSSVQRAGAVVHAAASHFLHPICMNNRFSAKKQCLH